MAVPYSRTILGQVPWYSALIVTGIALAIYLASREERRLGLPQDTVIDLALVAVPCGIVGARLYYVAMSWQHFAANPISALYIWQGGLAVYGSVIGGALGVWAYARKKRLRFAALADIIAPGLILAQAIGRWGNYFNMEAYGPLVTDQRLQFFPMAVMIPSDGGYVWHAATFFYESMWNLGGFIALWALRRRQKQAGNVFAWYLLIYGSGRFIIEQLRQDSLYLGPFRVSQYLSLALCIAAAGWLLWQSCANRRRFALADVCALLWIIRWACLQQPALYMLLLVVSGVLAVWLTRQHRTALAAVAIGLCLDSVGLVLALLQWPLSAAFALQIHTFLCSLTLPLGVWALAHE